MIPIAVNGVDRPIATASCIAAPGHRIQHVPAHPGARRGALGALLAGVLADAFEAVSAVRVVTPLTVLRAPPAVAAAVPD